MVIVQIESGKLKGRICHDHDNRMFYSFQNIPYAQPPLGKLRFKAPRPVEPWLGIRDATLEGSESLARHFISRKLVGSEDCLNLNVYTPEIPGINTDLRPVMFWIHGGVFMTGSNKTELFGADFLMPEDIVLVTINYRLGILGFLSLEDSSLAVPGNAGFKDMVMALKWVQKNIIHFSGDPHNVTVFGESAGAAAGHLLMLSPMAKGLFHKVIAQSACALNSWVSGRRTANMIAKYMGFFNSDDSKILKFLQSVPAEELVKAQIKIDSDDYLENYCRFFGYVIERDSDEEPFLNKEPIDIILSGDYNQVPLIIGYNEREGMTIDDVIPSKSRKPLFENLELSVPLALKIERGSMLSKKITNKIELFYFGKVTQKREDRLVAYYDMATDTCFLKDIYFSVKSHLKTSKQSIYFYRLSLETDLNIFKKLKGLNIPGVYHGDDIGYLFKTIYTPEFEPGSTEDIARRRMTKLWTNFARIGNPTPNPTEGDIVNVKWTPMGLNNLCYLDIGEELTMRTNPEAERMRFWEKIYEYNPTVCKL